MPSLEQSNLLVDFTHIPTHIPTYEEIKSGSRLGPNDERDKVLESERLKEIDALMDAFNKKEQEIKDSGLRQEFSSGAVRDAQENKGRFDLVPFWPLFAVSCIFESGAKKYAPQNWRKGMPISRYIDSAERHLQKFKSGFRDEPHLWQAFWNIACAIHTQIQVYLGYYPQEFNDLYSDFTSDGKAELLCDYEKKRIEQFEKK